MNTTTPNPKDRHVAEFINSVVTGGRGLTMKIVPQEGAEPLDCFGNVRRAADQHGGEIVFGWTIWEWPGVYIEAEHHAVWRKPDGELADITPAQDGEETRVFVADPEATYDFENEGERRDNIRKALSKDPNIAEFFRYSELRNQLMNSIPGVGEVQIPMAVAKQLQLIEQERANLIYAIGMAHTGPNDRCFCGSGLKFKKCHRH